MKSRRERAEELREQLEALRKQASSLRPEVYAARSAWLLKQLQETERRPSYATH